MQDWVHLLGRKRYTHAETESSLCALVSEMLAETQTGFHRTRVSAGSQSGFKLIVAALLHYCC